MTDFPYEELAGLNAVALGMRGVDGVEAYSVQARRNAAGPFPTSDLRQGGSVRWPEAATIGDPQRVWIQLGDASNLDKRIRIQGWARRSGADGTGPASARYPDGIPLYERAVRSYNLPGPSLSFPLGAEDERLVFVEQATLCPKAGKVNATIAENVDITLGFENELPNPGVSSGDSQVLIPAGATMAGAGALIVPRGMHGFLLGVALSSSSWNGSVGSFVTFETRDDPGDPSTDRSVDVAAEYLRREARSFQTGLDLPQRLPEGSRVRLRAGSSGSTQLYGRMDVALFSRGSFEEACLP